MKLFRYFKIVAVILVLAGVAAAGYATRDRWLPLLKASKTAEPGQASSTETESAQPSAKVIVNEQAQLNLGLTAKALQAETFWKTIQVPGMVVDRPGLSDRSVVAPVTGVVVAVHHLPGDAVLPDEELFTIRPLSETLHQTQTNLLKATQDIVFTQATRKRLAAAGGAISESQLIEADNQIKRLEVSVKAYRQELLFRGLSPESIDGIASGTFVREIIVAAPARSNRSALTSTSSAEATPPAATYEVQELKADLGQHVTAGQTLCLLADHRYLAVEGRAFRDETALLEKTVKNNWPVEVDFQEVADSGWGEVDQTFHIRHMSNTIDPINRTFAFRMPLENQSRIVEDDGQVQTLWRFRPGQKVRLQVRVAEMKNIFVLPADAVVQDGAEAFVFTQNVNTFERKPVTILYRNRRQIVIANDGSLPAGTYAVQSAAVQLNRMVKGGSDDELPEGYHIHADGSLHKNEE